MRIVTPEEGNAALRAVLERHPNGVNNGCTYVHAENNEPNCLFGHVLVEQFQVPPAFFHQEFMLNVAVDGTKFSGRANDQNINRDVFIAALRNQCQLDISKVAEKWNDIQTTLDETDVGDGTGSIPWREVVA